MENTVQKLYSNSLNQELGTVLRAEEDWYVLKMDRHELRAKRATSCMIEPEPGDLVLALVAASGPSYVLAVLEQQDASRARMVSDGNLEILLRQGKLSVACQEGIGLVTAKTLALTSGDLEVRAVNGTTSIQNMSFLGSFLQAQIQRIKLTASSFDSVLERFLQKVGRSYRIISEVDHVRAEQIDYVAKNNASLRAKNAMITAEGLVKLDGDQIHLG
jgi:hypothetical protein